jgi:hypothetical protein
MTASASRAGSPAVDRCNDELEDLRQLVCGLEQRGEEAESASRDLRRRLEATPARERGARRMLEVEASGVMEELEAARAAAAVLGGHMDRWSADLHGHGGPSAGRATHRGQCTSSGGWSSAASIGSRQ